LHELTESEAQSNALCLCKNYRGSSPTFQTNFRGSTLKLETSIFFLSFLLFSSSCYKFQSFEAVYIQSTNYRQ